MKNILLITDEMEVGGTQRQISNLLLNIDKNKINIELVYFTNTSHLVKDLVEQGIKVTHIDKTKSIDVHFIRNLIKYVRNGEFDVIHAFAISAEFWAFVAYLMSSTPKLVTSIRGVYEWYSPKHWFFKSLFSCFSYKIAGNSLAGIQYAKSKTWCNKDNYQLIYNGIDNKIVKNAQEDYKFDSKLFYILSVGRLIDGKNNVLLLKAAERLRITHPDVRFLIIGDGPDKDNLLREMEQRSCDNVELLGEKTNVDFYMNNANILVHPSLREGLSNTILEAFNHKLLVLASDADGNKELVKNTTTGLLFKNNDLDDFLSKLELILGSVHDYDYCIENAYNTIEHEFSIPSMCKKYQELYES